MNNIRKLRKKLSLTQERLGDKLSISKAAISKYETGKATLSADTIVALCDIFKVSSDYLLGLTDNCNSTSLSQDDVDFYSIYHDLTPESRELLKCIASFMVHKEKNNSTMNY